MFEEIYARKKVRERMKRNCLSEIFEKMLRHYQNGGMEAESISRRLHAAELFGDWLERNGISVMYATCVMAEEFIASEIKRRREKSKSMEAHFIAFAAGVRCAAKIMQQSWPRTNQPKSSTERELSAFCQFLEKHRGNCRETVQIYRRGLVRFLSFVAVDNEIIIERALPAQVHEYVMTGLERYAPKTVKSEICCSLRNYFKYKKICGHDTDRLIASIPRLRLPRVCLSPDILGDNELERLWRGFDRSTAVGRRDYAAARCMCDLGMRVGDVSCMELEDINWREGIIRVNNTKGTAPVWLPLPEVVGEAIADYLQYGRPDFDSRRVFLRVRAPYAAPTKVSMFITALNRVYKRQGLFPKYSGAHILRHTAATRMRRGGISLKAMADVLGHNHIQTTALYAQVDLPALRAVAQPWPGVQP